MKVRLSPKVRVGVALVATALIAVPLALMWAQSLVPSSYSVMDMGYADLGGRSAPGRAHHDGAHGAGARAISVDALTGPRSGDPDVSVTLTARREPFVLRSGERMTGYTLNHVSPGPLIRARQGDLVQVTLRNANVADGVTLHWHGIDVPNAEDGVAGVTQNAVGVGEEYVYRFVVEDAGTYWYHSHQISHEQVRGGLFGAFVIDGAETPAAASADVPAIVHTYSGARTVNGATGRQHVALRPGTRVRVRAVNTNNGALSVSVTGASFRVVAMDGFDLNEPSLVRDRSVLVGAGGRADLELTTPADGSFVRVDLGGGSTYLTIGGAKRPAPARPRVLPALDFLEYGSPAPVSFDPAAADRTFDYRIGRRPGFVDGKPGVWWSINGNLFPDVPMFVVSKGDIVRVTLQNKSGKVHPMHLHGHHALVLSRNGVRASGSPWWVDSLNVKSGETYEIAFRADNPGMWMYHCHDLDHAVDGLVAHLGYDGVRAPFRVGGKSRNQPE